MLVVLAVVIAGAGRPIEHAAHTTADLVVDVLEVAGIVVASAAVLGAVGWAALRPGSAALLRPDPLRGLSPYSSGRERRGYRPRPRRAGLIMAVRWDR